MCHVIVQSLDMPSISLETVMLSTYLVILLTLALYGFHRSMLVWLYFRNRHNDPKPKRRFIEAPRVTIQLPLFNEMYVAPRLLDAVAAIDYPRDRLQIQVLDDSGSSYQKLQPYQYHGSIYDPVACKRGSQKPDGEWNEQEIYAKGRQIKVTLNGTVIVDANLDDIKDEAKLKKHPGVARTKGFIGFLGHGARVEFRNLRIKEL